MAQPVNASRPEDEQLWEFQFGTAARNLDVLEHRWEQQLEAWEIRAIDAGCRRDQRAHATF